MRNPGIKWGLIAGVVAILVNIIVWKVSHEAFFNFILGMILLVVFVIFSIFAGLEQKRALGGFIDFKQALKPVFLTFVIGGLMAVLCTYVFYNFVDPAIPDMAKQHELIRVEKGLQWAKMPEDDIQKQLDDIRKQDYHMPATGIILTYFSLLIRYFVIAAIVSICIRKKRTV
jgi:hypothetical protein